MHIIINTDLSHLLWTKLGDNRNQKRRSILGQQHVAVCLMHGTANYDLKKSLAGYEFKGHAVAESQPCTFYV